MRLRGQVVDLIRSDGSDDADEIGAVGEITVVEEEASAVRVQILVQVIDATGVERRRAADDAVHVIALAQQKLSKVRTICTKGNTDAKYQENT